MTRNLYCWTQQLVFVKAFKFFSIVSPDDKEEPTEWGAAQEAELVTSFSEPIPTVEYPTGQEGKEKT